MHLNVLIQSTVDKHLRFFPVLGFYESWYYEHSWRNLSAHVRTHFSQELNEVLSVVGFHRHGQAIFPRAALMSTPHQPCE